MRVRNTLAAVVAAVVGVSVLSPAGGASAAPATDLFISEYVEGSANNKALELFNGTGSAVDLAAGGFVVQVYFNGGGSAGATINLAGTVVTGDVFVLAHTSAAAEILAQADQTSGSVSFNGDDAIVLRRGGASGPIVDTVGQVGVDPGTEWGTGLVSTADNTLRRAPAVTAGDPDPGDAFDPGAQWQGHPADTVDGLGAHPGTRPGDPPAVLTVGAVQGRTTDSEDGHTDRSPLALPSGNGGSASFHDVQGVITQRTLARTEAGASQHGFFLQSRVGADDGDPATADGIFVFMGANTALIDGYLPKVGDEVVLRGRVSEYFNQTQLTTASMLRVLAANLDLDTQVSTTVTTPPADSAAAARFWERHEGERMRVRAGSSVTGARDVFASTADSEIWLVDRGDPLLARTDPYARRVYRDPHPLDDRPGTRFDNGNGQRILVGSLGVKATTGDNAALLPPARDLDTVATDAVGGLAYGFGKYSVQPERIAFTTGSDPAANHAPRAFDRGEHLSVSTFNVQNLYDYRDDPFDGCDFAGNAGCPGVRKPFDYVPASEADYRAHLKALASQVVSDLVAPDLVLVQEAEDQDICTAAGATLRCGASDNADGKPDALQELALAIRAAGGPDYDAAADRDGADARGIVSAFLYRTDRMSLTRARADDPILGSAPTVRYRSAGLPSNAHLQNPKTLNAVLPADVDQSTGVDGANVFTRAPQVARFFVTAGPGSREGFDLWAVSNHFSSVPDTKVGQRTEQAAYGAAIAQAVEAVYPSGRLVFGGDLNVFPRPDDPIARSDADPPSDQLGPLYRAGLRNLWDDLVAATPAAAYSYVFQGQAQTLDHLFVNANLYGDFVEMRAAHVNADYAAGQTAQAGRRGVSDHDPQVARFRSRPHLSVADISVAEGHSGDTPMRFTAKLSRPLSEDGLLCASTVPLTATFGHDFDPLFGCSWVKAGSTETIFTVSVNGDRRREADESFLLVVVGDPRVRCTDPVAIGTIRNDD